MSRHTTLAGRTLLCAVVSATASLTAQAPSADQTRTLYAIVTNADGRSPTDLPASAFSFEIDGKAEPFTVTYDTRPGAFIVLLDRSGSMTMLLESMAVMSNSFAHSLTPGSTLLIAPVGRAVAWHAPGPIPANTDFTEPIRSMPYRNDTPLWDTVDGAIKALDGLDGPRSIVVVSDGDDTGSQARAPDVTKHAQQTGAAVHAIWVAEQQFGRPPIMPDGAQLRRLTEDTGGLFWRVGMPRSGTTSDPALVGGTAGARLSGRYAITFADKYHNGKTHDVKLRAADRTLKVSVTKKFQG